MGKTLYSDTPVAHRYPQAPSIVSESKREKYTPPHEENQRERNRERHKLTRSWCFPREKTRQNCIPRLVDGSYTSTVTMVTAIPVEKGSGSILEASVWLNACQDARRMMTYKSSTDRHTSHRGTVKTNKRLACVHTSAGVCVYSMY